MEVVIEAGINCNGDLKISEKLIDIASTAGCQYVKFQKRTINDVYTQEELDKYRESPFGTTNRDLKEGLEFSELEYLEIDEYCKNKGVKWFASPWDVKSVFFLENFDIPFLKVPSALITNLSLLEICRGSDKQIILSTGMSTMSMIDAAVDVVGKDKIYCIMHCTSTYPSRPDELNMRCIAHLKDRYFWTKIGFSNHYPGLMGMMMSAVMDVDMIELHATLDRTMFGSDQAASIEPRGIFELMERIRLIEAMKGDGVKKILDSEVPIIKKLRR